MSDYRKQLHSRLSKEVQGFSISYEDFKKDMQNPKRLKEFYGNLKKRNLIGQDVAYDDFAVNMGHSENKDLGQDELLRRSGLELQNNSIDVSEQMGLDAKLDSLKYPHLNKKMVKYAEDLKNNAPKYFDWDNKEAIQFHDNVKTQRDALGKELEGMDMLSHDYQESALAYDLLDQAERALSADRYDKGFFSGVGDTAVKRDTYTLGASDLQLGGYLYSLSRKFDDEGNLKNGESLTNADQKLLEAVYVSDEALSKSQHGLGYSVGSGAMASVPFMAQFMLTGGVGAAAAKSATKVLSYAAKRMLKKGLKDGLVKKGIKAGVGMTANAAARSLLSPTTYSGTLKDMAGEVRADEQGGLSFDPDTQKSFGDAFYHNYTSNVAENFSEVLGGEILTNGVRGLLRGGIKRTLGEQGLQALSKQKPVQIAKGLLTGIDNKWLQKAGFNGYLPEVAEEYIVAPLKDILHGEYNETKRLNFFSDNAELRPHLEIWLTTAVMTGALGGGHLAYDAKNRISYKRELRRQEKNLQSEIIGFTSKEELASLDEHIENGTIEELTKGFENIYGSINEFTPEQKETILKYANIKLQKKGIEGGLQQQVETLFNEQAEQVNTLTTDNGQFIKAKGIDGKEIFVVGDSEIELNEDGTVNYQKSKSNVIVFDPVNGERNMVSLKDLSDIEMQDAEAMKQNLLGQISQQVALQSEMEGQEGPLMNGDMVVASLNGEEEKGEIVGINPMEGTATVLFGDPVNGKTNVLPISSVRRFETETPENDKPVSQSVEGDNAATAQNAPKEFEVMLGKEPNKMIEVEGGKYRLDTEYTDRKTAEKQRKILENSYENYDWVIESEQGEGEFAQTKHKVVAVKKGAKQSNSEISETEKLTPVELYEDLQSKGYDDALVREEMLNEAIILRKKVGEVVKGAVNGTIEERISAKQQAKILEQEAQEYERLGRGGVDVVNSEKEKRQKAMETDDATLPLRSLIAKYFLGGGKINSNELQTELGFDGGSTEFRSSLRLVSNNAPTIDELQESLLQSYGESQGEVIASDVNRFRNEVIDVLSSIGRGRMNEDLADIVLEGAENGIEKDQEAYLRQKEDEYRIAKKALVDSGYSEAEALELLKGKENYSAEVSEDFAPSDYVPFSKGVKQIKGLTGEQADSLLEQMRENAEVAPEMELTPENWDREFGEDGIVETPIGQVKMGENQYLKMARQGRNTKMGMIKPTLINPDVIVEEKSTSENAERNSSYVFVKAFKKADGTKDYFFTSVTVSKDGKEVVISNQERRKNRIKALLKEGRLAHVKNAALPSESVSSVQRNQSTVSHGTTLSDTKDTQLSEKDQKVKGKLEQLSANNPKALPIVIVEKQADLLEHKELSKGNQEQVKSQMDRVIHAFVANGKVFFVLENIANEQMALEKWIHEQGIHGGMDAVFGENKSKILALVSNYLKQGKGFQELYAQLQNTYKGSSDIQIAEEYLAHLAEKQVKGEAFTEAEQGVWDKFKEILHKFLDLMYHTNYTLTDKQVAMIVESTVAEMNKQGDAIESTENNVKFAKNQNNGISQRVSQRERRTQEKEVGRAKEERLSDELRGRYEASERNAQENKRKISRTELEAQVTEEYAKEKGLWIPFSNVFDLGQPYKSGNENDNYYNEQKGVVYKVNNLMNNKGLVSQTLDNATYHNNIFSETELKFVGFTGFDGGAVYPIFEQKHIENATEASPEEIADYMQSLGFEQVNPTTFTNGTYTVSDLRPRNVLKDADGDIYVIDSEVEKKADVRFSFVKQDYDLSFEKEKYGGEKYEVKGDKVFTTFYEVTEERESYSEIHHTTTDIDEAEEEALYLDGQVDSDTDYLSIQIRANEMEIPIDDIVEEYSLDVNDYDSVGDLVDEYFDDFIGDVGVEDYFTDDTEYYTVLEAQRDNTNTDQLIYDVQDALKWETGVDVGKYTSFYVNRDGEMTTEPYDKENDELDNLYVSMRIADHTHNPSNGHNDLKVVIADNNHTANKQFSNYAHTDLEYDNDATVDEIVSDIKDFWRDYATKNFEDGVRFSKTSEMATIEKEAKAKGTFMKAPNGEPTNLNERQWLQVRTKAFKEWFGDWDLVEKSEAILNREPVAELSGDEFVKNERSLIDNVADFFNSIGNKVNVKGIGEVELNKRAIKDSISHGLGRNKVVAFRAIPNILTKGQIIDKQSNWKGRGYNSYTISAPITIKGERFVAVAVVNELQQKGTHRFYLHEVVLQKNLQSKEFKTVDKKYGSLQGDVAKVLKKLVNAKENSSKVVDENGEPLVVYHGTDADFTEFSIDFWGKNGVLSGKGFNFTSNKKNADFYTKGKQGRLIQAFLNLRNPFYGLDKLDDETKDYIWNAEGDYDEVLKSAGFDSKAFEYGHYLAYYPNQIKSATENVGTFDSGNDNIRFSKQSLERVNEVFNENLERFKKGELKTNDVLLLGKPMDILTAVGLPDWDIQLKQGVLRSKMKKHNLSIDNLKDLPKAIQQPIMVYEWGKKAKSMVVITELPHGKDKVTVAIEFDRKDNVLTVNNIASVHGKSVERLLKDIAGTKYDKFEDLLKYADKEKALDWLGSVPSQGEQPTTKAELISATNIIKNFENPKTFTDEVGDIVKFSLAYHGSPHSFDKFSAEYMGTGEGAQAYGWGLYFTDREDIAKEYSNNGIIINNEKKYDTLSVQDAKKWLKLTGSQAEALKRAESELKYAERSGYSSLIPVRKETIEILKENAKISRNLYKVKIHGDKAIDKLNFIRWDKPLQKKYVDDIQNIFDEIVNTESDYHKQSELSRDFEKIDFKELDGGQIYEKIAGYLGKKQTSLKLLEYGIDGIQYPTEYLSKDSHENSYNYVVFDENAIEIDEHIRFSKTKSEPVPPKEPKVEDYPNDGYGLGNAQKEYFQNLAKWTKDNAEFQNAKYDGTTKWTERFFDKMITVKNLQKDVEKAIGRKLNDDENAYVKELLRESKAGYEFERFRENYVKPLNKAIYKIQKKAKLEYKEVVMYLLAKHAIERNAYMEKHNGVKDGSGIETSEAEKIVKEFEGKVDSKLIDTLWEQIRKSTQYSLDLQFNSGLISKSLYNHIKGMYKYYVPMRGWDEKVSEDVFEYLNAPMKKGALQKMHKAKGRSSLSDDPIPYITSMAESAILQSGKNEVRRGLLSMARNNKLPQFYKIKQVWMVNTGTKENPKWVETEDKPDDALIEDGRAFAKKVDSSVIGHKITPMQLSEHQVAVYENGQKIIIEFVQPAVARAINGENVKGDKGVVLDNAAKLTRMLSRNFTSRNPSFTAVNFMRDMAYATLMNSVKHGSGTAFLANQFKCERALFNHIFRGKGFDTQNISAVNSVFNRELRIMTDANADSKYLYLGNPSSILQSAGIEDKPLKLHGSKLKSKARKHGFDYKDIKNLPSAVQNPIAVFKNLDRAGNYSILTELNIKGNNVLVAIDYGKGVEVDFNVVSSVFGKNKDGIVNWINKGYSKYINKEKILNYLQHNSAPIAAASNNQGLTSATKIVKEFENQKSVHQYLEEFLKMGGETGFQHLRGIEEHKKEMARMRKQMKDPNFLNSAEKIGMSIFEFVEKGNRLAEDVSRFTTYYTLRQKGMTMQQAAYEAKEITVNFNRKGIWSGYIGSLYAFFNAAMQGVHNFGTTAQKHKGKVAMASLGMVALGAVIPAICRMFGGYDDERKEYCYDQIPEYERVNHLILPMGGKNFLKIPLPHILRAFYGWGESIDGYVSGKKDAGATVRTMLGNFVDDLSPVSITGGGVRAIIPTAIIPFYDNMVNENFAGYEVYKEPFKTEEGKKPQYQLAGWGANKWLVKLSELSNKLGGGNEYRPASVSLKDGKIDTNWVGQALDWNPSKVEHVIEHFGGGMLTFLNNTYKLGSHLVGQNPDFESKNIPIARRFYREAKPKSMASQYYEIKKDVEEYKYYLNKNRQNGNMKAWTDMLRNTEDYQKLQLVMVYDKLLRKLKKAEDYATAPEQLNMFEEQKNNLYKQAVQQLKEIDKN